MKFLPKKSLGQNFLVNNEILNQIVNLGEIKSDDIVLEVGPGTGNLTEKINSVNISYRQFKDNAGNDSETHFTFTGALTCEQLFVSVHGLTERELPKVF